MFNYIIDKPGFNTTMGIGVKSKRLGVPTYWTEDGFFLGAPGQTGTGEKSNLLGVPA
jgi:hypothetical protein